MSFGEDRHDSRHVPATKYDRGDAWPLRHPLGRASDRLRSHLDERPRSMGLVEVKQFDGKFVESEDADIVCVFFSINSSAAIPAAPDQRTLAGLTAIL